MTTASEGAEPYTLSRTELDQILSSFEIPTCPAMVAEVMKEAKKDAPDIRRLAAAITADGGMAAVTLKMANSALFRSGAPVDNVQRALDRLGMRNVLSVVLGVALRSSMMGLPAAFIDSFWMRSSVTAEAAGLLARRLYGVSPDTAYTYAMFHDAAVPLMLRRFPDYPALIAEAERRGETRIQAERALPCTHPILGSLLVRNWGLSPLIAQAIRFHHEPDVYQLDDQALPGEALSLIAVGHVIEYILSSHLPESSNEVSDETFASAMAHLGMPAEDEEGLHDVVRKAMEDSVH